MKSYILGLAALAAVSVAFFNPSSAEARGFRGHRSAGHHRVYHYGRYHFNHYRSRGFHNWNRWYWNTSYGCYFYRCATNNNYYYWYQPGNCYLPATSAATYPPTATVNVGSDCQTAPLPPGI